jgi:ABC-type transporter Mla subunit MlaD
MPVQDLTPQLRTRLSRVERAVGWFVILATIMLLTGFAYYVYHTAERKGWFLLKLPYHTFVESAEGLHVGDPVTMMGFEVGQVTKITAMPPFSTYGNVYVEFIIREPFYGYIWTDSYVKLVSAGLLGNRSLEVVQGGTSGSKNLHESYKFDPSGKVMGVWNHKSNDFVAFTPKSKGYGFTNAQETPVITDRLDAIAQQAQNALPGIFDLTNKLNAVLTNTGHLTAHADDLLVQARPLLTNLASISNMLTNGSGSLGDWLIPTNLNLELRQTLASAQTTLHSANGTLNSANTNLTMVALSLDKTLENLANITSNLNAQVQRNDEILSQISKTIVDADDFVQGLKHHWLLRSAFKNENKKEKEAKLPANQPPPNPPPAVAPTPAARSAPRWSEPKTGKRTE